MKEKLRQFMIGRYGVDDLSRAQIIVSMVLLLVSTFLSAFFRVNILYWLGLALLIYSYFRILSRNVSKRYEENQRYLNAKYRAVVKKNNLKKRWAQRLKHDPAYNPNLSYDRPDFSLNHAPNVVLPWMN